MMIFFLSNFDFCLNINGIETSEQNANESNKLIIYNLFLLIFHVIIYFALLPPQDDQQHDENKAEAANDCC